MASHRFRSYSRRHGAAIRMGRQFTKPSDAKPSLICRADVKLSRSPEGTVAARRRRKQIREKLKKLQNLVIPGGTKLDIASMLDETIIYVQFLKQQICLHELLLSSFDALRSSSVDHQLVSLEDACISAASLHLCQPTDLLLIQSCPKPVDASFIKEQYNFSLDAAPSVFPDRGQ